MRVPLEGLQEPASDERGPSGAGPAPDIVIVCGPNIGVLDAWLPVLWKLYREYPNWNYILFFPRRRSFKEFIRMNSTVSDLTMQMVTEYVFPTSNDNWLRAEGFEEAMRLSRRQSWTLKPKKGQLDSLGNRARSRGRAGVAWVLKIIERIRFLQHTTSMQELFHENAVVLSDLEMVKLEKAAPFIKECKTCRFFSLAHGIEIKSGRSVKQILDPVDESYLPKRSRAYLYGEGERHHYSNIFHLRADQMSVVGVPRHDEEWLEFIIDRERKKSGWSKKGYVFLISRHVGMLPAERKREYVRWIRDLVWEELNLELVIKLHPREDGETVYEDVLGAQNLGTKWHLESHHAFLLGSQAYFAICFYSGVPLDMIRVGVPTIELLDIRGLPQLDGPCSFRDEKGNPVLQYRYNQLVLGASTPQELREQTRRIVKDRDRVVRELQQNYKRMFASMPGKSERIADEIARGALGVSEDDEARTRLSEPLRP